MTFNSSPTYSYFDHPNRVCMTYFNHLCLSMRFSFIFLKASAAAFVHAICPSCFITNTSETHAQVGYLLENSGCRNSSHSYSPVRSQSNILPLHLSDVSSNTNTNQNTNTNTNEEILFRV